MLNAYRTLKTQQEKEFNAFPMVFAFSDDQFKEAMAELGLKVTDTDKIYKTQGGGFYKKTDSQRLSDMLNTHTSAMNNAIKADKTGEGFIFDMFDYELSNHEFCYTHDTEDTLNALGLSGDEVINSPTLATGLRLAMIENREEI